MNFSVCIDSVCLSSGVPVDEQIRSVRSAGIEAMSHGIVFDVMRYSIKDGPGIRTTVFLKGCPLTCWWCHNPEGQFSVPEILFWKDRCTVCGECRIVCTLGPADCKACGKCAEVCFFEARTLAGRVVSADALMEEIRRDTVFYDQSGGGVTFSGGEPLSQPEFLAELLSRCKSERVSTAVDTTGYCDPGLLLQLARNVDLFLYDLKHMDNAKHLLYTGVSNDRILENLRLLACVHPNIHVRIPLVPGVNDDDANIRCTGEYLRSIAKIKSVTVLPYHRSGVGKYERLKRPYLLPSLRDPDPDSVRRAIETLGRYGLTAGGH